MQSQRVERSPSLSSAKVSQFRSCIRQVEPLSPYCPRLLKTTTIRVAHCSKETNRAFQWHLSTEPQFIAVFWSLLPMTLKLFRVKLHLHSWSTTFYQSFDHSPKVHHRHRYLFHPFQQYTWVDYGSFRLNRDSKWITHRCISWVYRCWMHWLDQFFRISLKCPLLASIFVPSCSA